MKICKEELQSYIDDCNDAIIGGEKMEVNPIFLWEICEELLFLRKRNEKFIDRETFPEFAGYQKTVKMLLDERTLLEGVAEEAAEVSQAALKLIRALWLNNNMTPVSPEDAEAKLLEEFVDVMMCFRALGYDVESLAENSYYNRKWKRWVNRLQDEKRGAE